MRVPRAPHLTVKGRHPSRAPSDVARLQVIGATAWGAGVAAALVWRGWGSSGLTLLFLLFESHCHVGSGFVAHTMLDSG